MTLTVYRDEERAWEDEVIPNVVHVQMRHAILGTKNQSFSEKAPVSSKTAATDVDGEFDLEDLSLDSIPYKRRRGFRCLMKVFLPFRLCRSATSSMDEDSESDLSSASMVALPESPGKKAKEKATPEQSPPRRRRRRGRLRQGRKLAMSRRNTNRWSMAATQLSCPPQHAGCAPFGHEDVTL